MRTSGEVELEGEYVPIDVKLEFIHIILLLSSLGSLLR